MSSTELKNPTVFLALGIAMVAWATVANALDPPSAIPDPEQCVVEPWDTYVQAFVSPGGPPASSSVDELAITVRTSEGDPFPGVWVEIDVSDCITICADSPDAGLTGMTDAFGVVVLNPRIGGCEDCEVWIWANSTPIREYERIVSTDWDGSSGDGQVDDADLAFLQSVFGSSEACADYDGSGIVDLHDQATLVTALGDANDQLCPNPAHVPPSDNLRDGVSIAVASPITTAGPGSANITLYLPKSGPVSLQVFDVLGSLHSTLLNEPCAAGSRQVTWNGRNDSGIAVGPGVYLLRLTTRTEAASCRMIVLR